MSKYKYSDEQFIEAVKTSLSIAEVCRKLGIKAVGGNYATVKNKIAKLNLDNSHFTGKAWNQGLRYRPINPAKPLSEILVKDNPYSSYRLAQRLEKEGLKEHRCEMCGRTEWEGYPINLELHHINGDHNDNRLENLQLICHNCHSTTENYRGGNIGKKNNKNEPISKSYTILSEEELRIRDEARLLARRKNIKIQEAIDLINNSSNKSIEDFPKRDQIKLENKICPICEKEFHPKHKEQIYCSLECQHIPQIKAKPSKEDLIAKLIELKCNFTQTGKHFGVSDNAIKKWCKSFNMPAQKANLIEYLNNLDNPDYIKPIETKKNRTFDKDLICKIYKEGYSQKEVASFIGCDPSTVRKTLKENNIEIRSGEVKKIRQYDLDGNPLLLFYGTSKVYKWIRENNISDAQELGHISDCCNGKQKHAYGYMWKYENKIPMEEIK